jgi:hypothetical protein
MIPIHSYFSQVRQTHRIRKHSRLRLDPWLFGFPRNQPASQSDLDRAASIKDDPSRRIVLVAVLSIVSAFY